MIDLEMIRTFVAELPETTEKDHFNMPSFHVKNKIFTTVNFPEGRATLRFTLEDQDLFCVASGGLMYPVPNRWGKAYGWTHINLLEAEWELMRDALLFAWRTAAPENFRKKHSQWFVDE